MKTLSDNELRGLNRNALIKTIKELQEENEILTNARYSLDRVELEQRIDKAIKIIGECLKLMPHEFDWEEQVINIKNKLQSNKENK